MNIKKNRITIYFHIILIIAVAIGSFVLGKLADVNFINDNAAQANTFNGRIYQISYPFNWKFEGPEEGPITGFPEFARLISPSGDESIVIGLKGDNRFEFVSDDLEQETQSAQVLIGNKTYTAEEQFLDINGDQVSDIVILEAEINDKKMIGYTTGSMQASLPMKIQILYRFSKEDTTFEKKLAAYNAEKSEAFKILQTFKLKSPDIQK